MKNFRKQFMELTLVFAVINTVALTKAFSQEVDYDEINRQNAEIASNQQNESKGKIAKFFFSQDFDKIRLPKNRKLNAIEKKQKNLVQCTSKFIEKRKGLYQGPQILQNILDKAMDNDHLTADSYVLSEVIDECWNAYNNLTSFKKNEMDSDMLKSSLSSLGSSKTAQFLKRQYSTKGLCIANEITGKVAIGMGVGAGVLHLKCLKANGVVRNYIGPKVEVLGGFGVKVEYAKRGDIESFMTALVAGSSHSSSDPIDLFNLTAIFGGSHNINRNYWIVHSYASQSVGVAIMADGAHASLNFRFINGIRNWSYVIDQLK